MNEPTDIAASESPDSDFIMVTLSAPIKSYGEDVSVIKMRKPNGADLLRVGNPVIFDPISEPPQITHNMARMQQMIARLANIPSGSLEKMTTQDWVSCAWAVTPFFMPMAGQT